MTNKTQSTGGVQSQLQSVLWRLEGQAARLTQGFFGGAGDRGRSGALLGPDGFNAAALFKFVFNPAAARVGTATGARTGGAPARSPSMP